MQKDLISRQMAIDTIMGQPPEPHYPSWYAAQIEGLPPAQPEPHWIPCNKQLPKDDEEVIVSCTDDSGDVKFSYTTIGWHYKNIWVINNERNCFIHAWVPLPAPFKE